MRKLAVAVLLLGCPSDKNSSGPIAIDDLFSQYLDAVCTEQVNCGQEPDKPTCVADANINEMDIVTLIADVKAGTILYDPDKAGACLATIRNDACKNIAPRADIQSVPIFCIFEVFTGTVAAGSACNSAFECESSSPLEAQCKATDSTCDNTTTCCASTCVVSTTGSGSGSVGDACGSALCMPTLYCSEVTATCKQPGTKVGDACESFDGCDSPLICNQGSSQAGTCANTVATGGTCDPTGSLQCGDERDYCDQTTMQCTRKVAPGGDCTQATCVAYATCSGSNTCVAKGSAGDDCTSNQCLNDLACVNNLCTRQPDGSACPQGS